MISVVNWRMDLVCSCAEWMKRRCDLLQLCCVFFVFVLQSLCFFECFVVLPIYSVISTDFVYGCTLLSAF